MDNIHLLYYPSNIECVKLGMIKVCKGIVNKPSNFLLQGGFYYENQQKFHTQGEKNTYIYRGHA